eukprot:3426085-Ditylum_brightwellii.AAC.1
MVGVATGQWCPAGACRGTWELIVEFLLLLGGKWLVWGADNNDYNNNDNDNDDNSDNAHGTKNGVNA